MICSKAQPQDFIKGWLQTEIWDEPDGTLTGWYGSHGGKTNSSWRDGNSCLGSWQLLVTVQQLDPIPSIHRTFWLSFDISFTHEYCRAMFSKELELLTKCCRSGALTLKTMRVCLVTHIEKVYIVKHVRLVKHVKHVKNPLEPRGPIQNSSAELSWELPWPNHSRKDSLGWNCWVNMVSLSEHILF